MFVCLYLFNSDYIKYLGIKTNMAITICKKYLLFTLCLGNILAQSYAENERKQEVNVVLLGATGDLAKRYLWRGFFNLYLSVNMEKSKNTLFRFYGAARENTETGNETLMEVLDTSIKCSSDECKKRKAEFIKLCSYYRLKTTVDYGNLQNLLETGSFNKETEIGRIFYLSVPPFAYEKISQNIAEKCRPNSPNTWVRVVVEKPFGSDLESAKELAEKLSKYWKEEEIYRIDHYLGKAGVTQIMKFKKENREFFENMWNCNHIEQVNIVVKERLDAQGRMAFYDQYGVIRDVFQNHLTEILALIASEMSEKNFEKHCQNSEKQCHDSKLVEKTSDNSPKSALLKAVKAVTIHDGLFGQYEGYNAQLKQEVPYVKANSNTPTFSAVVMEIQNQRWSGVPFVLVSGKSLDTRLAYVQIQFKKKNFCVTDNLNTEPENCQPEELTFFIQGEHVPYPLTILSKKLTNVQFSNNWQNLTLDFTLRSHFKDDSIIMKPADAQLDAYSLLIHEVFHGNKEKFVNVDALLLSWKIWNPLLEASLLIKPRLYTQENIDSLDFEIVDGKINFLSSPFSECERSRPTKYKQPDDGRLHSFHGNRLVSGHLKDVLYELANDLVVAIQRKCQSSTSLFHLALSGGSTSKHLFQILASMKYIPWKNVHIWLVDERCVSLGDKESNFNNMYQFLLKDIVVPYLNIHPMPVDLAGEYCNPSNYGDNHYQRQLRYHLVNGSLDFVVLGVGNDGHTASLFPRSDLLTSPNWVELTSLFGGYKRMTMTLKLLNQSKTIAVLLLGERKHGIVQKLAQSAKDDSDLPITLVNPVHGSLVWYIDDSALYNAV